MTQIILEPLKGISISQVGQILLGDSIDQVISIIGEPSSWQDMETQQYNSKRAFYNNLEMRVDYNQFDRIEFIEFIFGPFPEKTSLQIFDVDPFKIYDTELIKILTFKNNKQPDDTEAPYCYTFNNIGVGIWKDTDSKDIENWISEKRISGEYEADKNWLNEELEKSRHFWTIGIGNKEYYK